MKKLLIPMFLVTSLISQAQVTPKDTVKTQTIQEVLMTKKVFKKESDRYIYDISNAPMAKGSTTFDVLKQTPMLSSFDDKSLKIMGKSNAVIFINGRRSNMDAESLVQFLKNTPAENIQKIEVITTPGSEFDVDASDGIINIILKKKTSDGFNGNMRMAASANKYSNTSASFSGNYRKDKLAISGNITGSDNIQPQYYELKNGNNQASNISTGNIDDPNKNLGGYLNVDYELSDKSNVTLSYNSWANRSYNSDANLFNVVSSQAGVDYSISKTSENARSYNNSANLNYEYKIDDLGSKLNLNAAYLNYKRYQNTNNETILSNANREEILLGSRIIQNLPQHIDNFSGKVDFTKKFKNDFTLALGGNFNKTSTDNDTDNVKTIFQYDANYNLIGETSQSSPNHFIYDENIYAGYVTFDKKFSDKFSAKVGTRYEVTSSVGQSDNSQNEDMRHIERKYDNLLPYASLNYSISSKHNLSYAFSSRMRRPSFWEINPIKNILTENNYTQNNPFVKAASIYKHEVNYLYNNAYFINLEQAKVNDVITQVPLQRTVVINGVSQQQLRYIRTNFGDQEQFSAAVGMNRGFFKNYLTSNFTAGIQFNKNNGSLSIDPTSGDVFPEYINNRKSSSFFVQTSNTIRLDKAKTWYAGVNFFYVDKQQIELGMLKELMSLDLSIKKLWNDWTFALNVNDILKTNIVEIEDYQDNGNFNFVSNDQFRQSVGLSIVYNFGNKKVKKARTVDSAVDEIKSRTN